LNIVIPCTCIVDYTDTLYLYFMYLYHHYTSTLHCDCMYLSHEFTCIHDLIISVLLLHESLLLLHELLLHAYSYILIIWLFNTVYYCFLFLISISIYESYYRDIPIIDLRCAKLSATRNIVPHVIMLSCYSVHESVGPPLKSHVL